MSHRLIIKRIVYDDVERNASWYDEQRLGLGESFIDSVLGSFGGLMRDPERYRKVHGDVRRYLVKGFPYVVYYVVNGEDVKIFAVMHSRRDSRHWRRRIKP